jgi:hypothetical protein
MKKSDLESLVGQVRALMAEAYESGAEEALKRIFDVAQTSGKPAKSGRVKKGAKGRAKAVKKRASAGGVKRRAPRGAPRALVERVIGASGADGASASQIGAAAEGAVEKSVSTSAIRLELNRGKKERRYKVNKGKWSFAKSAKGS